MSAILLADSFNQRFLPLTSGTATCLMKLGSYPLLDYSIEFLYRSGIETVTVYTKRLTGEIEERIEEIKKRPRPNSFMINVKRLASWVNSTGDAIRDIHATTQGISGDVLLMEADSFVTGSVHNIITQHQNASKKHPVIMTMVTAHTQDDNIDWGTYMMYAYHSGTGQLLAMEHLQDKTEVTLETDLMMALPRDVRVSVRSDISPVGVYLVSPEFFQSFAIDNTDLNTISEFISVHLANKISESGINVTIHPTAAMRVGSPRCLLSAHRLTIAGWDVLMAKGTEVKDANWQETDATQLRAIGGGAYVAGRVSIGIGAQVLGRSAVAEDVDIESGAKIEDSFIGSNCKIGRGAVIMKCVIGSNNSIGPKSTLDQSITTENVTIGSGCTVEQGCLIGAGVTIDDEMHLTPRTRLYITRADDGTPYADHDHVGLKGVGTLYKDTEYDVTTAPGFDMRRHVRVPPPEVRRVSEEEDSDSGSNEDDDFEEAVEDVLSSIFADIEDMNTRILELKNIRLSYNRKDDDVLQLVVPVVMTRLLSNSFSISDDMIRAIRVYGIDVLVQSFLKTTSKERTVHFLDLIHEHLLESTSVPPVYLATLLQTLVLTDLLDDEFISEWHARAIVLHGDRSVFLTNETMNKYVEWLKDAASSESGFESDSDES